MSNGRSTGADAALSGGFDRKRGGGARPAIWLFALLAVCVGVPVALTPLPPITDLPNHYAQFWLEAGGVNPAYRVDWAQTSTNILGDLIAAGFGRLGLDAGPLILSLALAAPAAGVILLNRRLFGRWTAWQAGLVAVAWNWPILVGFLNFSLGLGLALIAAAAEPQLARQKPVLQAAGRISLCAVILLAHPLGLLFYGVLITALSFAGARGETIASGVRRRHWLFTAASIAAVFAGFKLLHPTASGADVHDITWQTPSLSEHLRLIFQPLTSYDPLIDGLSVAALLGPVVIAQLQGRLRAHAGLLVAALALEIAGQFIPIRLGAASMLETRAPAMALLAFAAGVSPNLGAGPRRTAAWAAAFTAWALLKSGWIFSVWQARQADVRAVERVLAKLPLRARLLPVVFEPSISDAARLPAGRVVGRVFRSYWHLSALAASERQAFVPILFAVAGQHPITVAPAWRPLADPAGLTATVDALSLRSAEKRHLYPYVDHWRAFDYILAVNADAPNRDGDLPPAPELQLIADEGFARLYRIRRPGSH